MPGRVQFVPIDIVPLDFPPPHPRRIDDSHYWRARANAARIKADQATNPETKAELSEAVATYEGLAAWAQRYSVRLLQ